MLEGIIIDLATIVQIKILLNYKFEILIIRVSNIIKEANYTIKIDWCPLRELFSKYNYINNISNEESLIKIKVELENENMIYKITKILNGTIDVEILLLKLSDKNYSILGLKPSENLPEKIIDRGIYIYT